MTYLKAFVRWLLTYLYRIDVKGLEHFHKAGDRILVVANHTSFLDAVLLTVFLPGDITSPSTPGWQNTGGSSPGLNWSGCFPWIPLIRYRPSH